MDYLYLGEINSELLEPLCGTFSCNNHACTIHSCNVQGCGCFQIDWFLSPCSLAMDA